MAKHIEDGDSQFSRGVNSNADPAQLTDGFVFAATNLVNRGGILQTRPGFEWKFNLPPGRRLQGAHLFRPLTGVEQILCAVDGTIYASQYPFKEYAPVSGISFREDVESVFFCTADKSVNVQEDGSLKLVTPFKVVIIQDGVTPPGVYDGSSARHLYKTSETPIGTHMLWTSDRLWIARGRELFVGDINDPTGNIEQTYLSNARSFQLDRPITALAEVTYSANASALAFTDSSCTAFKSHVRRRTDWGDPEVEFQKVLFPEIGCTAPRSITTRNGLLHWWSQHGLMPLDAALATQQTSEIRFVDREMANSKALIGDTSRIAGASFENYLLMSVPAADARNAHTWVSDAGPLETRGADSPEAWQGVWTGIRPVQWISGNVQGKSRIFAASIDYDGAFRVWEAFSEQRTDQGCPIQWSFDSRAYTTQTIETKEFRYAELYFTEIAGQVDLRVLWAGVTKGAFKDILKVRFSAEVGIVENSLEVTPETDVYNLKKQSRKARTKDVKMTIQETTSCGVESDETERADLGHMLRVYGSGQCAVRAIRVAMDPGSGREERSCPDDETDELNFVRSDGRAAHSKTSLEETPVEKFTSEQTYEVTALLDSHVSTGTAQSKISQADADKVASCHAYADAVQWYLRTMPLYTPSGTSSS